MENVLAGNVASIRTIRDHTDYTVKVYRIKNKLNISEVIYVLSSNVDSWISLILFTSIH